MASGSHENRYLKLSHGGVPQGIYAGVVCGLLFLLATGGSLKGFLLGFAIGFALGFTIARVLLGMSGKLAQSLVMPDAKGSYAPQHSAIQALEAQAKFAEARDAWLTLAAQNPGNPSHLLRAADLELRELRDGAAALALYEQARRIPGASVEARRYASQKVIDIHLGPGGDAGRALVELLFQDNNLG